MDIHIIHQYGDETHFKALYEQGERFGYHPSKQMVLSGKAIVSKAVKETAKNGPKRGWKLLQQLIRDHRAIRDLRDQIIIFGIAPYDKVLNKYAEVIQRNTSLFFTSHCFWDGSSFSRGTIKNKDRFEEILNDRSVGAFCVSEDSAQSLAEAFYSNPIAVVGHSVDYLKYKKRTSAREGTRKYIFIGQLSKRKNVPLILKWLTSNKHLDLSFDFVGNGPCKNEVRRLSKEDDRVRYLGYRPKSEIQEMLCDYDYLVLPSLAEPFGIVVIEALASGTPCITSDVKGLGSIIEDGKTGFVFNAKEGLPAFDSAMRKSLQMDHESLTEMRQAALNAGREYDTSVAILKWVQLLQRCQKA